MRTSKRFFPLFQFTPLVRGATSYFVCYASNRSFNSRPSCEGRRRLLLATQANGVSIHAPRARGDRDRSLLSRLQTFQFTPLVRGATHGAPHRHVGHVVSIHAPRARGDLDKIRSPLLTGFQFTPLVRGATWCNDLRYLRGSVSIHAPRARGDLS